MANALEGPRLYYSLFGPRGLLLGAKARLLQQPIEVAVGIHSLPHPVLLRLRTTDVALCHDVLLKAQYDWEFPRPPRIIVDAGANIGLTSLFYANKYPKARVIAIEPEPSNYGMLCKNAAPYQQIVPVHAALWKEDRELDILDPGMGHTTFQAHDTVPSGVERRVLVRGVTMQALMAQHHIDYIDLLKMDIEGAEKEIFDHSSAWIAHVGVIAVELHDRIREGCTLSVSEAAKHFEFKWEKGETTYFARTVHTAKDPRQLQAKVVVPEATPPHIPSKFPLKILYVL